jgi:hypothetical protein
MRAQDRQAGYAPPLLERLASLPREELLRIIQRLTHDRPTAERVQELLSPSEAVTRLRSTIERLGSGEVDIGEGDCGELHRLVTDIEHDVLPVDPNEALALIERLLHFESAILGMVDERVSVIDALADASVVWMKAAGVLQRADPTTAPAWLDRLCEFMREDCYGVRKKMLRHADVLFDELQLRELVRRIEQGELGHLGWSATAMADLAGALRDPVLYERALGLQPESSSRNSLVEAAWFYLECGDAMGALQLIQRSPGRIVNSTRSVLLDRIYAELRDTPRQVEIRRERFRNTWNLEALRSLEELVSPDDLRQLYAQIRLSAAESASLTDALALLFAVGDGAQAEELVLARKKELDASSYYTLSALADAAWSAQRPLAATVIWRMLLDDVLERAYSRAYYHAVRYTHQLREASTLITDYRGLTTHVQYEVALRMKHRRKAGFWAQVS